MSKRTKITIIVYVVITIIIAAAVSMGGSPDMDELRAKGVRAVYNDKEKFAELLKEDGLIYAFGDAEGKLKTSDIDLKSLDFKGENRKKKEEKALKALPETVLAAKFQTFEASYTSDYVYISDSKRRKDLGKDYEYVETLHRDIYSTVDYVSPSFYFLGREFEITNRMFGDSSFILGHQELSPAAGDHVIESEYLPKAVSGWLELEVKNGEPDPKSFHFYKDGLGFLYEYEARELAGESNRLAVFFGIAIIMSLLCFLTIWLQKKFLS